MGNGVSRQTALFRSFAALHPNGDELGCTFAVAHDGMRQMLCNGQQSSAQSLAVGRMPIADHGMRGFACGHHHERVIGGGIAIDGDAIERCVGQIGGQGWQQCRIDVGIGGQEAQHGGHVGANHARTFADAGDGDSLTRQDHLLAKSLGHRVGGHDAFGCFGPMRGLCVGQCGRHARHNAINGQVFHDHACGKRQDLLWLDVEQTRQCICSSARVGQAFGACARIRVAGVDNQCANLRING